MDFLIGLIITIIYLWTGAIVMFCLEKIYLAFSEKDELDCITTRVGIVMIVLWPTYLITAPFILTIESHKWLNRKKKSSVEMAK